MIVASQPISSIRTPPGLERICRVLQDRSGLRLGNERVRELWRAVERRMAQLGERNVDLYAGRVEESPQEWLVIIPDAVVSESHFFRDAERWRAIEDHVLQPLIQQAGDRTVRLWSAGCAAGEEAYSLSISCDRLLARYPGVSLEIIGTDINSRSLRAARRGVYCANALRGLSPMEQTRLFEPHSDGMRLRDPIRRRVCFETRNLLHWARSPGIAPLYDLILCQNVLIYLTPPAVEQVVSAFARALREEGVLILGHAEVIDPPNQCTLVRFGTTYGFRKRRGRDPGENAAAVPLAARSPDTEHRARAGAIFADMELSWEDVVAERFEEARIRVMAAPQDENAVRIRAWICYCQRDYDEARRLLQETFAEDDAQPESHFIAGMVAAALGELDDAIASFKRAVYLDPDFSVAHFQAAECWQRRGETGQACRSWRNAAQASVRDGRRIHRYLGGLPPSALARVCRQRRQRVRVAR